MESERGSEFTSGKSNNFAEDPKNEPDLPPEYYQYRDEGCDLAISCLNCPFARCVYDEPRGKQRWFKKLRAKEMARLVNAEGKGVKELALLFGVSQRTVQRALKVASSEPTGREQKDG